MTYVPYGPRISLRGSWVQGLLLACTCCRCFLFLLSNQSSILVESVTFVHAGMSDGSSVIRVMASLSSFTLITLESNVVFFWIDVVYAFDAKIVNH